MDLLVRLFRDQVQKRLSQRMQSEFGTGKSLGGGGLTSQISINNPLRAQSINSTALSQPNQ